MMIVGLTGGIGSGKTTVGSMFRDLGIPIYNSDKEAKDLMESSKIIKKAIIELLGKEAYLGKKLNKKYISNVIFRNKDLLEKLNNIVHPAVKKHFIQWVQKRETPYVIQEAAILFENSSYRNYDKIILITAPQQSRIQRIMDRDASSKEEIITRMKNQWSDSKKRELSDYVIENIDLETTEIKVKEIHNLILHELD